MLISCPLDCQHLKSWTDSNIITDVEQGRLCDTGDGGGVTLDNHFGEQLGIILHLLYNPALPLPGDILEKPVCGHRRCGWQHSDWPDRTRPSAPCPWAPDKFISLPQVFQIPLDNVRPRIRTSILPRSPRVTQPCWAAPEQAGSHAHHLGGSSRMS